MLRMGISELPALKIGIGSHSEASGFERRHVARFDAEAVQQSYLGASTRGQSHWVLIPAIRRFESYRPRQIVDVACPYWFRDAWYAAVGSIPTWTWIATKAQQQRANNGGRNSVAEFEVVILAVVSSILIGHPKRMQHQQQ